ncbi:VOC family protein [Ruminococcus flavefaciens]|uniref:VOC family protein n=1 Tax=Ruminococcus flavefaciens TaxID=1265 RepID=UPI00048DF44C|nr:VOC family protein [Ruminococcus flavefaciens]
MEFHINSLYLCVKDMDRAIKFYEEFFEEKVTERNEIYSVFDVNRFRLGLFAFEKKSEPHIFGSNCLPSISVESLDCLKEKLKDKEICFPLTQINNNWVAEFIDSEGNHIEITAPIK